MDASQKRRFPMSRQADVRSRTCPHAGGRTRNGQARRQFVAMVTLLALVFAPAQLALAERTPLKPGWNVFSPAQDIELGREASQQAEKQLWMLNDRRVDEYVNRLGQRLSAKAP